MKKVRTNVSLEDVNDQEGFTVHPAKKRKSRFGKGRKDEQPPIESPKADKAASQAESVSQISQTERTSAASQQAEEKSQPEPAPVNQAPQPAQEELSIQERILQSSAPSSKPAEPAAASADEQPASSAETPVSPRPVRKMTVPRAAARRKEAAVTFKVKDKRQKKAPAKSDLEAEALTASPETPLWEAQQPEDHSNIQPAPGPKIPENTETPHPEEHLDAAALAASLEGEPADVLQTVLPETEQTLPESLDALTAQSNPYELSEEARGSASEKTEKTDQAEQPAKKEKELESDAKHAGSGSRWQEAEPKKRKYNWQRIVEILLETAMVVFVAWEISRHFPNGALAKPVGLVCGVICLARLFFEPAMKTLFNWMFKYRWLIALAVFIVMVALQLHISNSGSFAYRFNGDPSVQESILFGTPRVMRTDEYNVQLPYYFSQFYNGYQQISHQMSITGQDMIVGYNAPVLAPTLIGKPFIWGYILLGNAYGLSWYFSSKLILMFMVSLEMFLILGKNRYMAVFGAFVLTFAPASQWWISPHFYDAIFWSCTLFVVGYWFFAASGWKKVLFTVLAIASMTGFVLALFPSLQVPCGLLMLLLMIACLWRDRKNIVWKKSLFFYIAAVLAGLALILVPLLLQIREPLTTLSETEYPGSRVSIGGYGAPWMLFVNLTSMMQPFADPGYLNNSEISSYTHFAVAFMIFYPYLHYCLKKQNNGQRFVGTVLFVSLIVQMLFLLFPLPEWLVKITLLSYANRMQTVFGLTGTIFTIWSLVMVSTIRIPHKLLAGAITCVIYGILSWLTVPPMLFPGLVALVGGADYIYAICIALTVLLFLAFTSWRQIFYCVLILWTAVSGLLVNPLMQGTASVTDYEYARAVQSLVEENPDAWWLSTGADQVQGFLLANGAKVLNGVNFYPDFEKWEILDPEGKDFDTENRYAHIEVHITGDPQSKIELISLDLIHLSLTPSDLAKLNVRYLSAGKAEAAVLDQYGIPYQIVYTDPVTEDVIYDLQPASSSQTPSAQDHAQDSSQTNSSLQQVSTSEHPAESEQASDTEPAFAG